MPSLQKREKSLKFMLYLCEVMLTQKNASDSISFQLSDALPISQANVDLSQYHEIPQHHVTSLLSEHMRLSHSSSYW